MSVLTAAAPPPVQPASHIQAPPQPRRWTAVEFDHLGAQGFLAGRRAFLLNGVIWEQGPMNPPHADGINLVNEALRSAFGAGWSVRVQPPLHTHESTNPMPDLAVLSGGVRDNLGRHPTTAALVVEVADTTLRVDLTEKAEQYATAGIADYWVLDLNARVLHVFRDPQPLTPGLGATAYRTHVTLGPTDSVAPLAAPNSPIRVADLLP